MSEWLRSQNRNLLWGLCLRRFESCCRRFYLLTNLFLFSLPRPCVYALVRIFFPRCRQHLSGAYSPRSQRSLAGDASESATYPDGDDNQHITVHSSIRPHSPPLPHRSLSASSSSPSPPALARATMAPTSVGDSLPDGQLGWFDENDQLQQVSIHTLAAGKKVILFGVPGAFTPTCRSEPISHPHFLGDLSDSCESGCGSVSGSGSSGFDPVFGRDPFRFLALVGRSGR
jgi:hypothetical protein